MAGRNAAHRQVDEAIESEHVTARKEKPNLGFVVIEPMLYGHSPASEKVPQMTPPLRNGREKSR